MKFYLACCALAVISFSYAIVFLYVYVRFFVVNRVQAVIEDSTPIRIIEMVLLVVNVALSVYVAYVAACRLRNEVR